MSDISSLICKNSSDSVDATRLRKIAVNMNNYYKNVPNNTATGLIEFIPLIVAFNKSVGYIGPDNDSIVFFQRLTQTGSNAVSSNTLIFSLSAMNKFWSNTDSDVDTSSSIDILNDFIINLGDKPINITGGVFDDFYTLFANPYCNFILDFIFCQGKNITFNRSNDNMIYSNNLYRFIRGGSTGDSGGTRGSGTLKLCQFCNNYIQSYLIASQRISKDDIYQTFAQNTYLNNFCGCCSQLLDYQPQYYKPVPGVSSSIVCQPICHKNEIIKAYDGTANLVNNGFYNNINNNDNQTFTRRQCIGQTICIIDKANITILGGDAKVQFNQICPSCADNNCSCYIDFSGSGGTLDSLTQNNESFQNKVTFNQNCPKSFCSQRKKNDKGEMVDIFVPCNPFNPADSGKDPNNDYNHNGEIPENDSQKNRDKYIFGLQNWLVPIIFLTIIVFISLCILIVNLINIKKELYIVKPKSNLLNIIEKS